MDDKIIVTNLAALKKKYGKGLSQIKAAINKLVEADKKHGINTKLIALDNAPAMKKLNAPRVLDATNPRQNKAAIDAVYKSLQPDYVMILGAIDVVPHQDLKNPVFDGVNDPDQFAYSDLPYACEAPYSQRPEDFTGPTRVVSRLPDLTGGSDPAYLVGLLGTAASWKSLPYEEYSRYFGITAKVWEGSTRLSLENLFGASKDIQTSPKKGPNWDSNLLSRRSHFINCHGAPADFHFYGQLQSNYPVSHDASLLASKISEGTVVAAECCYGGELYDADMLSGGQGGICNTYLANKAYGFFGSTTVAYGPAEGNGSADLICQYFLKHIFAGASLGRAALEARQEFVLASPQLDPVDLKTLAQFSLYGDPSIHPVEVPQSHSAVVTTKAQRALSTKALDLSVERSQRRQQLLSKGLWMAKNQPVASRLTSVEPSAPVQATLKSIAARFNLAESNTLTFDIKHTGTTRAGAGKAGAAKAMTPTAIHVLLGKPKQEAKANGKKKNKDAAPKGLPQVVAVVAKEIGGRIISYREVHAK